MRVTSLSLVLVSSLLIVACGDGDNPGDRSPLGICVTTTGVDTSRCTGIEENSACMEKTCGTQLQALLHQCQNYVACNQACPCDANHGTCVQACYPKAMEVSCRDVFEAFGKCYSQCPSARCQ